MLFRSAIKDGKCMDTTMGLTPLEGLMLGDEDKGYNPGYSFHGRMLALAQVEGMMAVVDDEKRRQIIL